jgi:NADH dehydrogenase
MNQVMRNLPRVVIIGAGFGGIQAAKALANSPVQVILVDKQNYHLFQPLLYQVATSLLAPSEIAYPVRSIFRHQKNLDFQLAEVVGADLDKRSIQTTSGMIQYDYLVVAAGGETQYYGLDSVKKNGFTLKELQDALSIRNHMLRAFELSTQTEDLQRRQALRTYAVVGGGPTGVECAGALSELIRLVLVRDYPRLDLSDVRVILLEMTKGLLPGFPQELGQAAVETLQKKGVEVRLGASVTDYDGDRVALKNGEIIPASTLIWSAGVRASSLLDSLGISQGRQGRAVVELSLQLPGHPEAFVIGDAAYLEEDGKPLPMMAPVAIQQGKLAARNIQAMLSGAPVANFEYKDPGSLATIGRNTAVARIGRLKFYGFLAWLVWLAVHLFWLIGFRNRLLVMINWAWDYFFYDRSGRFVSLTEADRTDGV